MSIRIRRLHADTSGLATVEFILAIPVFLILLLVLMDLGRHRTAMLHGTIAARNVAWAESQGGICLFFDELPDFVADASTLVPTGCSRETNYASGDEFWEGLDRAGGERLTETTSRTPSPAMVKGTTMLLFTPHEWTRMTYGPAMFEFSMFSHETFRHDAENLEVGYDRELYERLASGAGSLMDLFPNVLPGAR